MASKQKFRMAQNPLTGQFEWAPAKDDSVQSMVGWLIMAVSTVLFLLVIAYFVYAYMLTMPSVDPAKFPQTGSTSMQDEVHRLGLGNH